ncbi:MAG: cobalt ECF transporter T component CbiQ [Chloroflexota bacterium]|nr:cobalt ECF transporter T component CbiQ [Chloroflexota bacterium]
MKLLLDEYAHLDSPLHRWEPRCRLISLGALIFAFSFVRDLRLLLATLAASFALYALSSLPLSFLLKRLRFPGFFLLLMAVLLPFLSGQTVLLRVGPLALRQEGCLDLLLLVIRFLSILTTGLVLFGVAPFLTTIKTLQTLGLPAVLADMMLFSYRYIYEIGDDLERMETAMRLRGFRARRSGGGAVAASLGGVIPPLRVLASLAGSILVRSYERSERIYKAMVLRGYGRATRSREDFQVSPRDVAGLVVVLLVAAGFVAAEIILRRLGG